MPKKSAKKDKLKITQIGSYIGQVERKRLVLKALGFRKMNQSIIQNDTPEIRGMINSVKHLLKVEKIKK
ncbi:MAG: 50S ribosomal protein L30 [Candidatus Cloacimonetes bacterium]|nr:50S ribosomal protein L30 [Candidatus Cloacimonadota bacterium]MBL7108596.1 50S ribosomal protein L30 [Candidatus Cloacimonadota bacterium]